MTDGEKLGHYFNIITLKLQSVCDGVRSGPPGRSQQSAATTTITPPDAMFCGVFRLYLSTSPPHQCDFLVLKGHFFRNLVISRF